MKKRFYVALIMIVAVIGAFAFRLIPTYGVYVFDLLVGCVAILSALETVKMLDGMKILNSPMAVGIYPSMMFAGHMFHFLFKLEFYYWFVIQAGILVFMFLATYIAYFSNAKSLIEKRKENKLSKNKMAIKTALGSLFAFVYPAMFFLPMMLMNRVDALNFASIKEFSGSLGWLLLVCAIVVAVVSDTTAYFGGKFIGGVKLCPKLSPKKTVAGAVSAVVFTGAVMGALYFLFNVFGVFNAGMIFNKIQMWHFIVLGVLGSVVSQAGDLFESFLKRKADVKDSGVVFPGHGGFLDRLDSHLFAMPFTLLYFAMIFIIY